MRPRRMAACRADGRLYCLIEDADGETLAGLDFSASVDGHPIPVEAFPFDGDEKKCVIVLPYLAQSTIRVSMSWAGGSEELSFSGGVERWRSSLTYRLKKDVPTLLKSTQASWVHNRLRPSLDRYLMGDGCDVWRVSVTWDGPESVTPELVLLDGHGESLAAEVFPFEKQANVAASWGGKVNRHHFSVKVPEGCHSFVVLARDLTGRVGDGFCSCDERLYRDKEYETWLFMRDARADDEKYRAWFEEHRAKGGDLEAQAAVHFAYEPLISLVVPCFESIRQFLDELVCSVRAQSYGKWELLLLDASPDSSVVLQTVDEVGDRRVRRIPLGENRGIVGNTNAGIETAQGDYVAFLDHDDLLEPDCLFWYVREMNSPKRPDVLYCDEDLFERKGEWRQPIFKTKLNVDLLYSHNCVTHLLCVRRSLIDDMGLSSDDVSGAQDYDLTLRALGAGACFSHVPRVLYHWRQHEGSTSGDNAGSKPYAEEAGRVALERHLGERGVSASVEKTSFPFVYRVRYELPNPYPLVSIVIPSRDHVEVLRTCVESIFSRSTYDRLEVVIVENGSVEPETFSFYEEQIRSRGRSFKVVDATEDVSEGFNYSRLVNRGVRESSGEYLLLLNNDTEAISPDFVEEMMGYLQRPEVGVVGAKLYFRDGLTQHAGVLVGPYGAVSHPNQDFPPSREGYLSRAVRPGNFSAVTGACQMVRRDVFDEVEGYDEELAVGFNDVDFCFRVRETGRLVVFTPYAELFHYEFVSRGREAADRAKMVRWKREQALFTTRWPEVFLEGDPYSNSNLDANSTYYGL